MIVRVVERAVNLWAGDRAHRRIAGRFFVRALEDRLAARRLGGGEVVQARSMAARRTFAAARRRGIRCVLIEDLPDLRRLHVDLDGAAVVHPDARFLRRYRAGRRALVRQAAERVLADELVVRSEFARACRLRDGIDPARVSVLDDGHIAWVRRPCASASPTILLAGLAAARSGLYEALTVLETVPQATLVVRAGEGLEPPDALERPNVRAATRDELERLDGIDLVLAPAWCESDLAQITTATRFGIPVVATDRAGGTLEPGDLAGFIAATQAALA